MHRDPSRTEVIVTLQPRIYSSLLQRDVLRLALDGRLLWLHRLLEARQQLVRFFACLNQHIPLSISHLHDEPAYICGLCQRRRKGRPNVLHTSKYRTLLAAMHARTSSGGYPSIICVR